MVKKKSANIFKRLLLVGAVMGTTGCATPKYRVIERENPATHEIERLRVPAKGEVFFPEDIERAQAKRAAEEAAKKRALLEKEREQLKKAPLWARAVWPLVKPYYQPPELVPPPGCLPVRRKKVSNDGK